MRQARRGKSDFGASWALQRWIGYSAIQSKNVLFGLELLRK